MFYFFLCTNNLGSGLSMEWSNGVESWKGAMEWSFGVDFVNRIESDFEFLSSL